MKTMKEEKVHLLHPEGKHAPAISRRTYDLFEKAVLATLKKKSPLTFATIAEGVNSYVTKHDPSFEGSREWYTVSVKLHLEATGVIEAYMDKGRKLHRLK